MPLNLPPPPPPTGGTGSRTPLGVPAGYTVEKDNFPLVDPTKSTALALLGGAWQGAPKTTSLPPRYFTGDELVPASLSPEKIATIQKQLVSVGLIGPKTKFRIGLWDETTKNAYKNLLEVANTYGVDQKEALARIAASPAVDGTGAGAGALSVKVTNPDDLRETFDTVARAKLGRKLAPGEVDRFVRAYQAAESGAQETDYANQETGGSMTAPADPQSFLSGRLAREYSAEVGSHDLAAQFGEFGQILNEVGG